MVRRAYNNDIKLALSAPPTFTDSRSPVWYNKLTEKFATFKRGARPGAWNSYSTEDSELGKIYREQETKQGVKKTDVKITYNVYAGVSNSDAGLLRKTGRKGKGSGKGQRARLSDAEAVRARMEDLTPAECIIGRRVHIPMVECPFCGKNDLDGFLKCPHCFQWVEAWQDSRLATELCRLESQAAEIGITFSRDKVTGIQPRRQRLSAGNSFIASPVSAGLETMVYNGYGDSYNSDL